MTDRRNGETRLMIAGSGGQGILFLGRLICQAAMLEDMNVTWFPSYGAEMRGGTANCTVVISREMIGSPIVRHPNLMIILNSASMERFEGRITPEGSLFYDSSLIERGASRNDLHTIAVPASRLAGEMGNQRLANMVLLGTFAAATGIVSKENLEKAVALVVSSKRSSLIEMNISAIERGFEFAANTQGRSQ